MSKKSGKLVAREVAVSTLDPTVRDAMWNVFVQYYAGVSRQTFDADLSAKQRVITVLDTGDRSLQGFSTIEVCHRTLNGRRVIAVFSGDTIVDQAYWGQKALQTAFFLFLLRTKLSNPGTPLYWFLVSKGYKTYLLLSRSFLEYWPRHDQPTPAWQAGLLDALARDRFGSLWDADAGILRMQGSDGKLKQGVAVVDQAAMAQPDIRFFVSKNRGYAEGDELACIGLIDLPFALAYAKKRVARLLGLGFGRLGGNAPFPQGPKHQPTEPEWVSKTASS